MTTTRLINRILYGTLLFIAFCFLCSGMETLSTLQFFFAKLGIALLFIAGVLRIRELNDKGLI